MFWLRAVPDKLRQLASELERANSTRSLILATDLTEPGAAAYVLDQTTRAQIVVDILVNNAGFGQYGFFAENDLEECLRQIQLNVTTLTHLSRLYLPEMIARKEGRILNVASTAAFQPGPLMAVYFATKAYVLHLSEALANELQGTGVTVTCLCPGATATEFHKRANATEMRLLKMGSMDPTDGSGRWLSRVDGGKTSCDFRLQELAGGAVSTIFSTTTCYRNCTEDTRDEVA